MKKNYLAPYTEIEGMIVENELLDNSIISVDLDKNSDVDAEDIDSRKHYGIWEDED